MSRWRPETRRQFCLLLGLGLSPGWAPQALAATRYQIDQRYGTIAFSVSALGMFKVQGRFPRFMGELVLDMEHPERSKIDVAIDAATVEMPLPDQTELLRSEAYFDAARHPRPRFTSTAIQVLSPTHYIIHGALQIRGITRPQVLDAVLADRHLDPERQIQVADFLVTGEIDRASFGMTADRPMLSNTIELDIRIHLAVGMAPDGR